MFLEKNDLSEFFCSFSIGLCYYFESYLFLVCFAYLRILSHTWFIKIFFLISFAEQKHFHIVLLFFFFVFVLCALGMTDKELTTKANDKSFYLFLLILPASCLTFRSLIHFELVFMCNSISFFCRWISSFPDNIYQKGLTFSNCTVLTPLLKISSLFMG